MVQNSYKVISSKSSRESNKKLPIFLTHNWDQSTTVNEVVRMEHPDCFLKTYPHAGLSDPFLKTKVVQVVSLQSTRRNKKISEFNVSDAPVNDCQFL